MNWKSGQLQSAANKFSEEVEGFKSIPGNMLKFSHHPPFTSD